jgi:hypothetical protein
MEEHNNQQLIDMAHGMQEEIKMKLLDMIQQAANPFDIIYEVAHYLEDVSAERGYAQHIIDNIHTIYGIALEERKPLEDEIKDITARAEKIQQAIESGSYSEEEKARLDFALKAHQRKINQLKETL